MSRRNHRNVKPQARKSRVNGTSTPRKPRELDAIKASYGFALFPTVGSAR